MPLQRENVELVLEGLDQKTSSKLVAPGRLEIADNVQFSKTGQLDKRRGYQTLEQTQIDGVVLPDVLARLAVDGDELLVFSQTYAFAMLDPGEAMQGTVVRAMVRRGFVSFGNVSTFTVAVSTDTEGT